MHKLDVIVNKNGDVRTIRCVPCGQLTWSYDSHDVSSDESLLKPEIQYTAVSILTAVTSMCLEREGAVGQMRFSTVNHGIQCKPDR